MFDQLMGKIIPPRLALDTLTANCVTTFGHPVKCYKADLFFPPNGGTEGGKVDVLVTHADAHFYPPKYQNETHQHKYWLTEGPELIKIMKFKANELAESQEGSNRELQHLTIEYNGKDQPYVLTFYVKEGNEKIKIVKEIK